MITQITVTTVTTCIYASLTVCPITAFFITLVFFEHVSSNTIQTRPINDVTKTVQWTRYGTVLAVISWYGATINLQFTQFIESILIITSRIRRVGPVVVVDDVPPVYDTRYVCRIGYCGFGIAVVLKT